MPVTWQDIQERMPAGTYQDITGGNHAVTERCIKSARLYLEALLRPCAVVSIDEDADPRLRDALIRLAVQEMYAFVEREDIGLDKDEKAKEMLRGLFGPCVGAALPEQGGRETSSGLPVGHLKQGRTSYMGF